MAINYATATIADFIEQNEAEWSSVMFLTDARLLPRFARAMDAQGARRWETDDYQRLICEAMAHVRQHGTLPGWIHPAGETTVIADGQPRYDVLTLRRVSDGQ